MDIHEGKRILTLVTSDKEISTLIIESLGEGYSILSFSNLGDAANAMLHSPHFSTDILLIDENLNDGEGKDFCYDLRNSKKYKKLPMIILTENQHVGDKWLGLSNSGALGIDDFIIKPFKLEDLKNRLSDHLHISAIYSREKKDEVLDLSPLQLKILDYLAHHEGEIYERNKLIEAIWGLDAKITPRTVDQHISKIKKKISQNNPKRTIKSIYGVGYMLTEKK